MKHWSWKPYLAIWVVLNLIQSAFTELFHDEALYWMFSQHLEWGFWDHPPAAPFLIFLGYSLIPDELGVRLFTVLANALTIYLLWRITRPQDNRLFFSILFSMFLIHIGGFMAAPDIPLILTTALFFWVYKQYAERDDWRIAFALGVIVAAIAYSKYHGAIILFFALLSNLKLLKRPSFYWIPSLALLLFLPHLYWQYVHDFATFKYHLIDRGKEPYDWMFILDYLGGQLAVLGPLISIPVLIAGFRYQPQNDFERTLKWSMAGVFGFFLFQSFNQRTEANWTATAIIPLVYLAYHFLEMRPRWQRWIYGLALPSLILLMVFRLYLMVDFLPTENKPRNEFHGWDEWAQDIQEIAEDRPVVFLNTFRAPSKYRFYTGAFAHSLNVWGHSGNQYDLMTQNEAFLQGKEVVIVSGELKEEGIPIRPGGIQDTKYRVVEDYRSYSYPSIGVEIIDAPEQLPPDTMVLLDILVFNKTDREIDFTAGKRPVMLFYHVYKRNKKVLADPAFDRMPLSKLAPGASVRLKARLRTPAASGEYRYRFTFHVIGLHNGRNDNFHELMVE